MAGISDAIIILLCISQVVILYRLYMKTETLQQLYTIKKMIGMGIVSSVVFIGYFISVFGLITPQSDSTNRFDLDNMGIILSITVFFPIAEELINRGILLNQLNKKYSFLVTNIIQAVIFGILHFDFRLFLLFFAFGIVLGVIKKYMNIYCAMLIHIFNNTALYFMSIFAVDYPDIPHYCYLIIGVLSSLFTLFILLRIRRYSRNLLNTS